VDLAGLGAALALANILTVLAPYPMDKRAGSPLRQAAQGYAAYGLLGVAASLAGVALAASPVLVAVALTGPAPAGIRMTILVLCSAAYGLALAWAGVRIAARAAEGKLPELCQIAIRSKL
jgi:ABC-2 type transport system permease protein